MSTLFRTGLQLAEAGWLPDFLIRWGIRRVAGKRLQQIQQSSCEKLQEEFNEFLQMCRSSPLAVAPVESNQQHYEVPTEFFRWVLGKHRKYSSCYWSETTKNLDEAEALALQITCERAELMDGQSILELGCGWGSLSLWMAEHYPRSQITVVSHSRTQKKYIEETAQARSLANLKVICSDINDLRLDLRFDRIVSVEMFEHLRNHEQLFHQLSHWLNETGKVFIHVFCQAQQPALYESHGPEDWMTDYFFTGGMMPSDHLFVYYQNDLRLLRHWRWNGTHYQRTSDAWLQKLDQHRSEVMPILEQTYGQAPARLWLQRWRMFFMACAETFGYQSGNQWWVAHYLFEKR